MIENRMIKRCIYWHAVCIYISTLIERNFEMKTKHEYKPSNRLSRYILHLWLLSKGCKIYKGSFQDLYSEYSTELGYVSHYLYHVS